MEVVESFLRYRRDGDADGAIDMIAPNATIGFPYGGYRSGTSISDYLRNERGFRHKEYLNAAVPLVRVDDNTFQRRYKWDRACAERGSLGLDWFTRMTRGATLRTFREVYFVRDGKIAHVVTNVDPAIKSFERFARAWENPATVLYQE